MSVSIEDGSREVARCLSHQIVQRALAERGIVRQRQSDTTHQGQHLIRALDDLLLLGADQPDQPQRLIIDELLTNLPGPAFSVDLKRQQRQQSHRHNGQQTERQRFQLVFHRPLGYSKFTFYFSGKKSVG